MNIVLFSHSICLMGRKKDEAVGADVDHISAISRGRHSREKSISLLFK